MHLTIIKIIKGEIYDWFLNGGAEFCVAKVVVLKLRCACADVCSFNYFKGSYWRRNRAVLDLIYTSHALLSGAINVNRGRISLGRLLHLPHLLSILGYLGLVLQ